MNSKSVREGAVTDGSIVAEQGVGVYVAGVRTVSYLNAEAVEWVPGEACEPVAELLVESESLGVGDGVVAQSAQTFHVNEKLLLEAVELFVESQDLGTVVEPRCGGCKCGKCPIHGQKYCFKEQQEHDVINNKLYRVEVDGKIRWMTEYPWKCLRSVLPRNEKAAYQNLCSLQRSFDKNPGLEEEFNKQVEEMIARGAAVVLSEEQLSSWKGDYYYLPLVGVKSKNKRFRLCFDASRRQGRHPSLNDCLMKGPDRFINNLVSVVTGFRNGRVGAVADIVKFHNQVYLPEIDMHMQRFLWRKDKDSEPFTCAVRVNNFGVMPANCIATCALRRSADAFAEEYPEECADMKDQTYVDDQLVAAPNRELALEKTRRLDEIADHAGMPNRGWIFSGDSPNGDVAADGDISDSVGSVPIGCDPLDNGEKVLGLLWIPKTDMFVFHVVLTFDELVVKSVEELNRILGSIKLTRTVVLANVARIFDPPGFLCPVILMSRLLMRETWNGKGLGWKDELPADQVKKWLDFLSSLLELKGVHFRRSLWPDEEVVGLPTLVIFSDGSKVAYGAVAYIRWQLEKGGYWTQIIMAKNKIAPKKGIITIPRMELNGAVVGNRMKNFLLKETNLKFAAVYQLVDSSTVLGYLQKDCGHFNPYEGTRIAEVQSTAVFKDGKLVGFAWVAGEDNPADWCTKPRHVKDLMSTFWVQGPDFLSLDVSEWPIRHTYKKENLEGELKVPKRVFAVQMCFLTTYINRMISYCSSWKKLTRVFGRLLRACQRPLPEHIELSAENVQAAKTYLIKFVQKGMKKELEEARDGKGRYRKLAPVVDDKGVFRVGTRLKNHVPFTFDGKLPILLPPNHRVTLLVMQEAHAFNHAGQDGSLSRFRMQGYWTVRGGQLAKNVRNSCIPCRKNDPKLLSQVMGEFPSEMHKNPIAWGYCQMDLAGPYSLRGDVNPRTTKKTWVMVLEDLNSGAVHLDIVQDYSAEAVMLTMRRFGSVRGWPGVIYSDPGSQLVSASDTLVSWWSEFGGRLRDFATGKNFQWNLSPPDSPWRQGKVERRIGILKKLLRYSVGDTRVTPVELQTILFETANIINERPLGLSKPREDGSYVVITPNQLLLGRSQNILPDDTGIADSLPMTARYRLVNHVTNVFWRKWSMEVSPNLIVRQKWHTKTRNLCVGDLVMICESTKLKSKYRLAIVDEVKEDASGVVRSGTLRYCNIEKSPQGEDKVTMMRVVRSVQRLVLIMPVEEMSAPVVVKEYEHYVQCAVHV